MLTATEYAEKLKANLSDTELATLEKAVKIETERRYLLNHPKDKVVDLIVGKEAEQKISKVDKTILLIDPNHKPSPTTGVTLGNGDNFSKGKLTYEVTYPNGSRQSVSARNGQKLLIAIYREAGKEPPMTLVKYGLANLRHKAQKKGYAEQPVRYGDKKWIFHCKHISTE